MCVRVREERWGRERGNGAKKAFKNRFDSCRIQYISDGGREVEEKEEEQEGSYGIWDWPLRASGMI
jgi:hypothetical protein